MVKTFCPVCAADSGKNRGFGCCSSVFRTCEAQHKYEDLGKFSTCEVCRGTHVVMVPKSNLEVILLLRLHR